MLTLSPETEALVRARATVSGKTPDRLIREAFAAPAACKTRKEIDWPAVRALLDEFDQLPVRDPRDQKTITDEGWGV